MAIKTSTNFEVRTNLPLDPRTCVDTLADRDIIPVGQRYIGLKTTVAENGVTYILEGGITNDCWVRESSGDNFLELITETGTVTLQNTARYPFNNSLISVSMTVRNTKDYTVEAEVSYKSGGGVGEIVVSDKTLNGFKLAFTGSAKTVSVTVKIRGGMLT